MAFRFQHPDSYVLIHIKRLCHAAQAFRTTTFYLHKFYWDCLIPVEKTYNSSNTMACVNFEH